MILDNVQAATAALQAENGSMFLGKPIQLAYARETSDRISKRNGTYVPKSKRAAKSSAVAPMETEDATTEEPAATATTTELAPPSHILLAQDLPADATQDVLQQLFQQYTGFKELRLPRPGLAFCEFESEPHATLAIQALQGFKLTAKDTLKLNYGKAWVSEKVAQGREGASKLDEETCSRATLY